MKKTVLILSAMLMGSGLSWGLGKDNLITLNNTLRLAWNDNYYQATSNKTSTGMITEQPEIMINLNRENTFLGLRYRPSFVWFTESSVSRRQTVQHELDASLSHTFSPRFSVSVVETFRRGVQPELQDRNNALILPDQSYMENTVNGTLGIQLRQSTRLDASGRFYIMRYDNEAVSTNTDYNIASAGLTLRQEVSKATTISGSLNYDNTSYRQLSARSANTFSIGGGVDHTFGPRLLGSLSGGYQLKSFELASISGQNSPYGNFSLTYLFNPRLRFTAGASYSLWEADIQPYASQERLSSYASLGYDLSTRVAVYLSGGITRGKYLSEQTYTPSGDSTAQGGNDTIYQGSLRASYMIDRHNFLEATYQYTKAASDVRADFAANLFDLGWRLSF